ncbi:MAG TPA: hypothetical protein VHR39_17300 [Propionibacteriaceae bacterium]|nr:hypothetical protein [Propionibacteriaceae bacterium]
MPNRIATNACLTALEQRGRRALPSGLGGPASDPDAPPGSARSDVAWLEPVPDALVTPDSADPATIVTVHESLRLALIAGLQYLPARQRAIFLPGLVGPYLAATSASGRVAAGASSAPSAKLLIPRAPWSGIGRRGSNRKPLLHPERRYQRPHQLCA